jgi:hypothetical protein
MKNKSNANNSSKKKSQDTNEVEVLYQRMGDRWFAFSLIEDEVYVGSLTPEEIIDAREAEASQQPAEKTFKISGKA